MIELAAQILLSDSALTSAKAGLVKQYRGENPSTWPVQIHLHSDDISLRLDSENPPLLVETLRRLADVIEREAGIGATHD